MQVLNPRVDLAAFYDRLAAASERALMLDYDGTLAPFRIRPEEASPYPGVIELLDALIAQGDTRVVIVSGRRAVEVAAMLRRGGRLEIWGAHGWERIGPDGDVQLQEPSAAVREALESAEADVTGAGQLGMRIERKPASIALHWRGLPASAVAHLRDQVEVAWKPFVDDGVLAWLPFDGGVELRARGTNKQHAVKAVLSETGPNGVAAYLGDDVTDEDAFQTVKLRGLAVLVRPEYRRTAADLWIRPPHELLEFIDHWRRRGDAP